MLSLWRSGPYPPAPHSRCLLLARQPAALIPILRSQRLLCPSFVSSRLYPNLVSSWSCELVFPTVIQLCLAAVVLMRVLPQVFAFGPFSGTLAPIDGTWPLLNSLCGARRLVTHDLIFASKPSVIRLFDFSFLPRLRPSMIICVFVFRSPSLPPRRSPLLLDFAL